MRSIVVAGGTIVAGDGRWHGDVLIEGGVIVALGAAGSLRADHVIDAGGMFVMPGLVDAHVHVRDPGFTHKEDFGSASRAAAAGGITTMLVMPYDDPVVASRSDLLEKRSEAEGRAFVDFGLEAAVGPANLAALSDLAGAGAVSVEVEMCDPPAQLGDVTPEALRQILCAAREQGLPVGVSCQDQSIVAARRAEGQAAGRDGIGAHQASEPDYGEALSAMVAIRLARCTGAAVHLRQVSIGEIVSMARQARDAGADITTEVTPHHLLLTEEDASRIGVAMKVSPPLRSASEVAALQAALASGAVDVVATDHAPHAEAERRSDDADVWSRPGGFPGLETMLPAMVAVCGLEGLETVARCCSRQPAERFGLGDRKGQIRVGYDGDVVVFDPDATWTVDPGKLSSRDKSSPFAGRSFQGKVVWTLLRGRVIAGGADVGTEPTGQWLTPSRRSGRQ